MMKKLALFGLLASAMLTGYKVTVPVEPYQPGTDPFYRSLLYQSAVTPTHVNTAARDYLLATGGVDVPDTLRVLVIRIEFPEDDDSTTWGNGKMDLEGFGTPEDGLYYDPPHDKTYFERQMQGLRNFYLLNSRGRLIVEYDIYPEGETDAYLVPHQMAYYGDSSNLDRGLTLFMRDALIAADKDPGIDFSRYHYQAGSQSFDMIVIFHAGSTRQSSVYFGYVNDLASATVTPGALEAYTGLPYVEVDADVGGVQLATASIVPESPRAEGVMTGLPGIHYHEFAHLLGAFDVYDVTGYTQGVGAWSLMGGGGWLGVPAGQIPSMHDAFHRYWFGWEDPVVVTRDTTISLYSAEFDTLLIPEWELGLRPSLILVPIRYDESGDYQEYFLVENRQTDFAAKDTVAVDVEDGVPIWVDYGEYDAFQPGQGIIVWHVDEDIIDQWGENNLINAWRAFGRHNAVDMEEADGIQDYELLWMSSGAYATQGSVYDPYYYGAYDELATTTNPTSDGYYGETGISVKVLDESDTVMRVQISFDGQYAGFPQKTPSVPEATCLLAINLDGSGDKELLAIGEAGNASFGYAWYSDGTVYGNSPYINNFFDGLAGQPAAGDVDGDGADEVVIVGSGGSVAVFDSLVNDNPYKLQYALGGRSFTSPMLADLDGDADLEILAADEFGSVYALDVTDSIELLANYPIQAGEEIRPGFAMVDDGLYVFLTTSGRLYLVGSGAQVQPGFPLNLGKGSAQNDIPPVVADFSGDGEREIAVLVHEYNDYRYKLISLSGEVIYTSTRAFTAPVTSPALADLDADGLPELLFGSGNGLWGLDLNGSAVSAYPIVFPETYAVQEPYVHGSYLYFITFYDDYYLPTAPVVADFTGDGEAEIAVGSPDFGVDLIKPGAREPYKTLYTRTGIAGELAVFDLDNDGKLEIGAATSDSSRSSVHVWETKGSELVWGQWMGDAARTGLLATSLTAPSDPSEPLSGVYVYPNPASDHAYLRAILGDVTELKVDILDISGTLIASIEPGFDANNVNDIPIDEIISSRAPGLYIIRVEAISGSESTVELYKLGIVR